MNLNEQHYIYFNMRFNKKSNKEIAETLNLGEQTISNWNCRNEALQKEYIKYCRQNMTKDVSDVLNKLKELTKSDNEAIALGAVKDYLDRVDLKAATKIEQTQNITVSTDTIKEKLLKLREQNNNNVDNVDKTVDKQKKEYKYDDNGVYNKYKNFDYDE